MGVFLAHETYNEPKPADDRGWQHYGGLNEFPCMTVCLAHADVVSWVYQECTMKNIEVE
jgi:hypothetical protein